MRQRGICCKVKVKVMTMNSKWYYDDGQNPNDDEHVQKSMDKMNANGDERSVDGDEYWPNDDGSG